MTVQQNGWVRRTPTRALVGYSSCPSLPDRSVGLSCRDPLGGEQYRWAVPNAAHRPIRASEGESNGETSAADSTGSAPLSGAGLRKGCEPEPLSAGSPQSHEQGSKEKYQ